MGSGMNKETKEVGESIASSLISGAAEKLDLQALKAEREAVIHCINIYGDSTLHNALDSAGLLMDGRDEQP